MKKILIIEDEPSIRELVVYNLESEGYIALQAEDGVAGITAVYTEKPDIILLDIMLPGKDGYEICKELRSEGNKTPIIMLTAKTDELDKVLGLEFGADDYMEKPFGIRELMARIKAVLRRYSADAGVKEKKEGKKDSLLVEVKGIIIDLEKHTVTVGGNLIDLTYKEFELLYFLANNKGRAFSRDELLDKVWGIDYVGETRTVDVHIRHLRMKLAKDNEDDNYIETIRGKGYKFKE
ncbi:MAG: response regulator transcription factor [Anaerovoracaceae bacterium]